MLMSAFLSADLDTIVTVLSTKGVISKDEAQISLASTENDNATFLVTAIDHQIVSPEKFQHFLNVAQKANLSLSGDIVETLKSWSDYYHKMSAFSSARKIAAVLSLEGVLSNQGWI